MKIADLVNPGFSVLFLVIFTLMRPGSTLGTEAGANSGTDLCGFSKLLHRRERSKIDFVRDWGFRLLKDDDPAFLDPEYHRALISLSSPGTAALDMNYPGKYDETISDFNLAFYKTMGNPYTNVIRLTNSGTDANNALYEFAEFAFRQRTGKIAKRANLLFFANPYAGVHGRAAEISIRYPMALAIKQEFEIPTPHLKSFVPKDVQEAASVTHREKEALDFIRRQVARDELEIGGIFIEPISATKGIYVYRPEFMMSLRKLADELRVPIFADEVLTGGGRTGHFWGYQNYEGFEPDLITFGKGLVVSGVAQRRRWNIDSNGNYATGKRVPQLDPTRVQDKFIWLFPSFKTTEVLGNTSLASPLVLLQATQVLNRIRTGNLINQANENGKYFLSKMKEKAKQLGFEDEVNGFGMLLYGGPDSQKLLNHPVKDYLGRWTPPINLTKEEIDELFRTKTD